MYSPRKIKVLSYTHLQLREIFKLLELNTEEQDLMKLELFINKFRLI